MATSPATAMTFVLVAEKAVPARLARYAREIGAASLLTGVDPLLIAAVLDRETLGGTAPQLDRSGPAGRGDNGHGHGLMQIDDRSHASFLAATSGWTGRPLWAMAEFNILYAAMGLRALIDTWRGDELRAVAAYNAGSDALRRAIAKVPVDATPEVWMRAYDSVTAGRSYVSDVTERRRTYREALNSLASIVTT